MAAFWLYPPLYASQNLSPNDISPQLSKVCVSAAEGRLPQETLFKLLSIFCYSRTPLSVMGSISLAVSLCGLIEACKQVIRFISSAADRDAPQTARNMLCEAQTLQVIFRQLQELVSDRGQQNISRRERIYLDDLVATLTGCVCVFSELDGALEGLDTGNGQNLTAWDKTKWAAKEESIEKILRNLQMNKSSLQWMLSIYLRFVLHVLYFALFRSCSGF